MRKVLEFPQIDEQKLEFVQELIDSIAEKVDKDCRGELNRLNSITGKEHTAVEFAEYWGWTDLESLARITLTPEPPCIHDLTKTEIEEIIAVIKDCLISVEDDKADYYIGLLRKSLPLTNVMDYIMSGDDIKRIADDMISAASSSVVAL
ncbi:MAG: hypothetical protein J6D08_18825 [Lachnospiraceae bacterium]|nr:hypothetical protein [Lachnospiraceae bacterium]